MPAIRGDLRCRHPAGEYRHAAREFSPLTRQSSPPCSGAPPPYFTVTAALPGTSSPYPAVTAGRLAMTATLSGGDRQ